MNNHNELLKTAKYNESKSKLKDTIGVILTMGVFFVICQIAYSLS